MDQEIFNATEQGYHNLLQTIGDWLTAHGFQIIVIILIAWVIKAFGTQAIMQVFRKTVRKDLYPTKSDREKRLKTLESLISAVLSIAVFAVAVIMILSELGINTAPMIASAGIIGIALGFGTQSLVKDLTSGLFIIIENQYRVGDVVELDNGVVGQVEAITIRTTMLRTLDGTLYHVPNGTIGWTANKTASYGGISEELVVSLDSDMEKVELIVNRTGEKIANDPKFRKMIIEAPHFLRVDGFAPNGIRIKIIGKTCSDDAWDIKGVFYKQLIKEFRKANITIPYNQITVTNPEVFSKPSAAAAKK